jgi:hypothetical protein
VEFVILHLCTVTNKDSLSVRGSNVKEDYLTEVDHSLISRPTIVVIIFVLSWVGIPTHAVVVETPDHFLSKSTSLFQANQI